MGTAKSQNGGTTFYGGPAVKIIVHKNNVGFIQLLPTEFHYLSDGAFKLVGPTNQTTPTEPIDTLVNAISCAYAKQYQTYSEVYCGPTTINTFINASGVATNIAVCGKQSAEVCSLRWGTGSNEHLYIEGLGQLY